MGLRGDAVIKAMVAEFKIMWNLASGGGKSGKSSFGWLQDRHLRKGAILSLVFLAPFFIAFVVLQANPKGRALDVREHLLGMLLLLAAGLIGNVILFGVSAWSRSRDRSER